jgi:transposase
MSTRLLYHAFGLVGYQYVSQLFEEGEVLLRIDQPRERLRCAHCNSQEVWAQGAKERQFRTIPIGGKPVSVYY